MPSEHLRNRVADCVREILAELPANPEFHALLTDALSLPGRALAPVGHAKWLRFVAEPCVALGGAMCAVPYAAAAVEFVLTAADVVDDIADGDWDFRRSSLGCGVNASFALSHLAQRALDRLTASCTPDQLARVRSALNTSVLQACVGEDLDLRFETRSDVGVEQAHAMTVWKSGALVAMACRMGAALATDDEEALELVATFGSHVGVIAQLLNDSAALIPNDAMHHTDIQWRKKTLPISFALHYAREKPQAELLQWAESHGDLSPTTCARIATEIQELGALHYAWVVADTHRREALATLRTLQGRSGRNEVWALRRLIPALRAKRVARRDADA